MKHVALLIIFFLCTFFMRAQIAMDKLFLNSALNTGAGKFISTADNGNVFCGIQVDTLPGTFPQMGHIVKIDASYNFQWAKNYSKGISSSSFSLKDIVQLVDHGYLALCEITDSISPTNYSISMALLRTDSLGNLLYVKSISDSTAPFINTPVCLTAITDSTFYIGTSSWGNIGSIGICKISISGTILKSQYFRVENSNHTASLHSVTKLMNGQFLITGSDYAGWVNATRLNFVSLDDDLNLLWYKSYYSPNQYILTRKMLQDSDSSIWAFGQLQIGNTHPNPLIIKLNQTADLLWANQYIPSLNYPMDFRTAVKWNNSFLAAGTNGYLQSYIPFILKLDTAGAILANRTFTHINQQYFINDLEKQNDSIIMFISSKPPGAQTYGSGMAILDSTLMSPCSNNDMFFTATSTAFTLDSAIHLTSLAMLSNDITSQYQSSPFSLFEVGLCSTTSTENFSSSKIVLSIYPNPAVDYFIISLGDIVKSGSIEIFNAFGENISKKVIINEHQIQINLENFSSGIYFVTVFDGEKHYSKKLIVAHD